MDNTIIERRAVPGTRKTRYRILGPSFPAVQNEIASIMDEIGASQFTLPRRVGDHFEAVGFTLPRATA